jgi:hypothetical protein
MRFSEKLKAQLNKLAQSGNTVSRRQESFVAAIREGKK